MAINNATIRADIFKEFRAVMSVEKGSEKDRLVFLKNARTIAAKYDKLYKKVEILSATDIGAATKAELESAIKERVGELGAEVDRVIEK